MSELELERIIPLLKDTEDCDVIELALDDLISILHSNQSIGTKNLLERIIPLIGENYIPVKNSAIKALCFIVQADLSLAIYAYEQIIPLLKNCYSDVRHAAIEALVEILTINKRLANKELLDQING